MDSWSIDRFHQKLKGSACLCCDTLESSVRLWRCLSRRRMSERDVGDESSPDFSLGGGD